MFWFEYREHCITLSLLASMLVTVVWLLLGCYTWLGLGQWLGLVHYFPTEHGLGQYTPSILGH
jgi:hypothetical protein